MNVLDKLAHPHLEDSVRHAGKMLPNQPFTSGLYQGKDHERDLYELLEDYSEEYSSKHFDLKGGSEQLASAPMMIAVIAMIAKLLKANRILEIGTYVGCTTMHLARIVGDGGQVHTIEKGQDFHRIAVDNFNRNRLINIRPFHGEASFVMSNLTGLYDLIFIDGGKENYPDYVAKSERLLAERGAIIVDDVFFHGDALNKHPQTPKGRGCKKVLDRFKNPHGFQRLLLPIGNGMLILLRT